MKLVCASASYRQPAGSDAAVSWMPTVRSFSSMVLASHIWISPNTSLMDNQHGLVTEENMVVPVHVLLPEESANAAGLRMWRWLRRPVDSPFSVGDLTRSRLLRTL